MNKKLALSLTMVFMISMIFLMPATKGQAAAGTTGVVQGPSTVQKGIFVTLEMKDLTDGAEYILVPSITTTGAANYSFTASDTTEYLDVKLTGTSAITFSLYGASGGANSGAALSTYRPTVQTVGSGVVDVSIFTDLISFLFPILILIGLLAAFKFREQIREMVKGD